MFPKYPYLDLSDRNLDFITRAIREMENEVKNFVTLNAVKYAKPIQWSINRQYEKNTIVIDPLTGTAFISVQPVPNGVSLTRTQYWTPVFDLSQFVTKAASNFANSYERDITTTATMATGAGDWVVWDSTLYVALTSIHAGDAYVVNGNIKRMTVEDFYDLLMEAIRVLDDRIDDEIQDRQNADSALGGRIDDEIRDRQDADSALGGRIDDEIRDREGADIAIGDRIDKLPKNATFNVLDFGAKGDGVTSDSIAIQSAIDYAVSVGGGIVYIPPTGKPYIVDTPIIIKQSVTVMGSFGKNFMGLNVNDYDWTKYGTWIEATDTAFKLRDHGCALIGVNIFYPQNAPAGSFAPIIYNWAIDITATFFKVSDVMIVGASHGIRINYNSASGGGAYSSFDHIYLGCFNIAMQFHNVNDIIHFNDIQIRPLWYMTDAHVVDYLEHNCIGIDSHYFDNPSISDIQFFNTYIAIKLTDETCYGNTHSMYNAVINNAQFNLVNYGIVSSDADTHALINITNSLFQTDTETLNQGVLLDVDSPNIQICVSNCRVNSCKQFATIGGVLLLDNSYVAYGNDGISRGISLNTNALCYSSNNKIVKMSPNAGVFWTGANAYNGVICNEYYITPWTDRYDPTPVTSDGSFYYITGEYYISPTLKGFTQMRIQFQCAINLASANDVMRIYCNGHPEVKPEVQISTGVDAIGDSGWLDLTSDNIIGQFLLETNSGVVWVPKSLTISFR